MSQMNLGVYNNTNPSQFQLQYQIQNQNNQNIPLYVPSHQPQMVNNLPVKILEN
jgi:hypothetical protein